MSAETLLLLLAQHASQTLLRCLCSAQPLLPVLSPFALPELAMASRPDNVYCIYP